MEHASGLVMSGDGLSWRHRGQRAHADCIGCSKRAQLDAAAYPFARQVAMQLREYDDREQFIAGVDLILAGIDAIRRPTRKVAPRIRPRRSRIKNDRASRGCQGRAGRAECKRALRGYGTAAADQG
ncbi:MAG: hypothetical protein QM778_17500 [Myxococcales bacterium]